MGVFELTFMNSYKTLHWSEYEVKSESYGGEYDEKQYLNKAYRIKKVLYMRCDIQTEASV